MPHPAPAATASSAARTAGPTRRSSMVPPKRFDAAPSNGPARSARAGDPPIRLALFYLMRSAKTTSVADTSDSAAAPQHLHVSDLQHAVADLIAQDELRVRFDGAYRLIVDEQSLRVDRQHAPRLQHLDEIPEQRLREELGRVEPVQQRHALGHEVAEVLEVALADVAGAVLEEKRDGHIEAL